MDEKRSLEANKERKKHPIEKANVISRLFFWYVGDHYQLHYFAINTFFSWLMPYFVEGFKRELNEDDMYGPLKTHEAVLLGDKLEKAWNHEIRNKKNPSLWRAILKVFSKDLILYGIFYLFLEFIVR